MGRTNQNRDLEKLSFLSGESGTNLAQKQVDVQEHDASPISSLKSKSHFVYSLNLTVMSNYCKPE